MNKCLEFKPQYFTSNHSTCQRANTCFGLLIHHILCLFSELCSLRTNFRSSLYNPSVQCFKVTTLPEILSSWFNSVIISFNHAHCLDDAWKWNECLVRFKNIARKKQLQCRYISITNNNLMYLINNKCIHSFKEL